MRQPSSHNLAYQEVPENSDLMDLEPSAKCPCFMEQFKRTLGGARPLFLQTLRKSELMLPEVAVEACSNSIVRRVRRIDAATDFHAQPK
ncbi:hypothetical protein GCM10028789_04430 [Sinomonas halotolerans]